MSAERVGAARGSARLRRYSRSCAGGPVWPLRAVLATVTSALDALLGITGARDGRSLSANDRGSATRVSPCLSGHLPSRGGAGRPSTGPRACRQQQYRMTARRRSLRIEEPRMTRFATMTLPEHPTVVAPDGSDVRVLLGLAGGGLAHFELPAGATSRAVRHRTVEEIWYVLAGRGEMWRSQNGHDEVVSISRGTCLTIPLGTVFQFRSFGGDALW